MNYREHELQTNCVKWFRYAHPKMKLQLFNIPNGAFMPITVAKKQRAEGMTAGVADLFLMAGSKGYHGMWIEMKAGKNRQSVAQKQFQQVCELNGFKYVVCRSFGDFMEIIKQYLRAE